ncbi:hypothetical protein O9G_003849 [Rozella allomycis CSF55]|uniref:Uncharacterized protein n=1 Tax=Rozella allomycis (strain CSF55) TaxID=988480 RepID=A0A075ARX8_ROZAC|nr:hypothetical protein O9G_003849 [Rozella allomycis CSF55]|eukprot:EPZ33026.1 hypothetical protein O9G_003849 [Rozella allomycis CSF55]
MRLQLLRPLRNCSLKSINYYATVKGDKIDMVQQLYLEELPKAVDEVKQKSQGKPVQKSVPEEKPDAAPKAKRPDSNSNSKKKK